MHPYPLDRSAFPRFRHPGTLALVELHEIHLRRFLDTWMEAEENELPLPASEDPDYASLEILVTHVLTASGAYLAWMCRSMNLDPPDVGPAPETAFTRETAPAYLERVLAAWRLPLVDLEEEQLYRPGYPTSRGIDVCVETMLQHAVMHPIRHDYQLRKLLGA